MFGNFKIIAFPKYGRILIEGKFPTHLGRKLCIVFVTSLSEQHKEVMLGDTRQLWSSVSSFNYVCKVSIS